MNLHLSINKNLKFYNNLSAIEKDSAFFVKHGMRNPAKTLVDKMTAVDDSLDTLLEKIKSHHLDSKKRKAIFDYIESINGLYDGLLLIMKATTEPNIQDKNETDIKRWLERNNKVSFTSFKDATASEHKFIRDSANLIKHGDIKTDYLNVTNHKDKKVYGFYLSSILDEEQLSGAIEKVHKKHKKSASAFSFNHFLLRTAGVIALYYFQLNKIIFGNQQSAECPDKTFYKFFTKFIDIKEEFFPDEYLSKYAFLSAKENSITISYPYKYKRKEKFDHIKHVRASLEASQTVQLPYFSLLNIN